MTDHKSATSDPSMDDILASIRRIISDDEARAQVATGHHLYPRCLSVLEQDPLH